MKIKKVRRGQQLKASTVNHLIDASNVNTPNEGRGSNIVKGGSGGWSIQTPETRQRWEEPFQPHPWEVLLETKGGVIVPVVSKGEIYDGLASIEEITPAVADPTAPAADGDVCCLEYTYDTKAWKYVIVEGSAYEETTTIGDDPKILVTSRVPLAQIETVAGSSPTKLAVKQMVRNHLVTTTICINGLPVNHLIAL
jgi:hypothetical protein